MKNNRDFLLTKEKEIPEIQCLLRELTHKATGAKVLHLANDDPENLFCLSFQTRPTRSDGVAHILEHTVLCGSEKYPVKDPFFAMTRRSLNTFMNALTGADFTCYPAASQIPKDFYNLLSVYLDAVFHPRLLELSFKQEGHRLSFSDPQNPESPLEIKGIVFNEMKGALSSAMARLSEAVSEALFPDLTYGVNSGGDPKVIPQLTYQQLKHFHETYYHPSHCLFFFYGNMPLESHLDFITEHCLKRYGPLPALQPIPSQPRFKRPVYRTASYPDTAEDSDNTKCYIALAWLTCHILEQDELLALTVLDTALMDNDASPLRMALLKSHLCKQANSTLECEISEVPWILILRGCQEADADTLEHIARQTLENIAKEGIPQVLIESAIHQLELQRSEITGDSAPYGLSLFWRSALLKQHGGQPEDGLVIHSLFHRLRERIAHDPRYLSSLLRRYLIDNPHFARIVLVPDLQMAARELADERAHLDKIQASMSPLDKEKLIIEEAQLARFQKEQEHQDLSVLPRLELTDVPPQARDFLLHRETVGQLEIFHHACFTNQIVYADLVFPLCNFTVQELPRVRFLTRLLSEMGSGGRDYRATLEYMQQHTGGVDAALGINTHASDPCAFQPTVQIRGKALYSKGRELFSLMRDMIMSVDLTDKIRLKEVVLKHYTAMEGALNSHAMRYAISLSASVLSPASRLNSLWFGLEYFWSMRDLAQNFDLQANHLVEELEALRARLLHLSNGHLVLSCDQAYYETLKSASFYDLAQLPSHRFISWTGDLSPLQVPPQGRLISAPVAFTAKVFPAVGYTDPDSAYLGLAAHIMENNTLHSRIREQGGAYGGGAVNSPMNGQFYFFAYRDPHIAQTLKAFDEAVEELLKGDFSDEDLEEAKLELIQQVDAPVAPGSRAALAHGWWLVGKSHALRQANRERILTATREKVIQAVHAQASRMRKGMVVVFGGRGLLEKENRLLQKLGLPSLQLEKV